MSNANEGTTETDIETAHFLKRLPTYTDNIGMKPHAYLYN